MDIGNDVEQIVVGLAIALLTAVVIGGWRLYNDISWIKTVMAKEYSGNSGGMREKLNGMGDQLDDVSHRLDSHITQHVEQGMEKT